VINDDGSVVHEVRFAHPLERVWNAIADRTALSQWLMQGGFGLAGWRSRRVAAPAATPGARIEFTFAGDFNPVMEVVKAEPGAELEWRCLGGHDPRNDNTFRFQLAPFDDGRTRLRFWQEYAVELSDDAYGPYNFNWGYYLESLRMLCTTGAGKPFDPAG
jgi:uncharacterized protein YndB with AHSA1/START domain